MYGTGLGPGGTVWDQGGIRMRVGLGQSSPPALSGVADGCYGPAVFAAVHYPYPWVLLGMAFSCGGLWRGSGASCPYLDRLFKHRVQILPGLVGANHLNSRRQRRLLTGSLTPC